MTFRLPRDWTAFRRIAWRLLAAAWLALVATPAIAASVVVVLSDDSAPYHEVYEALRARLDGSPHDVSRVYAKAVSAASLGEARLAVAIGVRAAETLASVARRPPVLAVLVPRAWYLKTGRALLADGSHVASAIYLDQPFERQMRLVRLALPEARRVGVVLGTEQAGLASELGDAARAQEFILVPQILEADDRLVRPLESVLTRADVLLAVPDPAVFNRNTAQSLFLTSYRYRVPVFGYSRSLTRAGALLSLHSSPAEIGRQAAEVVDGALQGPTVRLPAPAYPAYASVSVNEQVARSLGVGLPSETELERGLGGQR